MKGMAKEGKYYMIVYRKMMAWTGLLIMLSLSIVPEILAGFPVENGLPSAIDAYEDTPFSKNLSQYFTNPDGNEMAYENLNVDGFGKDVLWLGLDSNGTIHGLPGDPQGGVYYVLFDVRDTADNAKISDSFVLTVNKINDPPVITIPGDQIAVPGTTLSITGISIADPDSEDNPVKVFLILGYDNTTISLAQRTGLTFLSGDGLDDNSMYFTGTLANINAAISTLTYKAPALFTDVDTLTVAIDDQGNTGSGGSKVDSKVINIHVAMSDPVNTGLPIEIHTPEKQLFTYNLANHFTDPPPDSHPLKFEGLFVDGMGLDISWLYLDENGTIHGFPENQHIGGYYVEFYVTDTVDFGYTVASFTLYVDGINDPPAVTVPFEQSAEPETAHQIMGIKITDPDAGNNPVRLFMTVSSDRATLDLANTSGLTFAMGDGIDDKIMLVIGTFANINAALSPLIYQGDAGFSGTDKLTITVDDQGNTGVGGNKIATAELSINVARTRPINLGLPAETHGSEQTAFSFNLAQYFIDPPPDSHALVYESLQIDGAGLDTSWLALDTDGTLHGMPLNAHSGTFDVQFTVKDSIDGGYIRPAFKLIIDGINDPPAITVPSEVNIEPEKAVPITGIKISDQDVGNKVMKAVIIVDSDKASLDLAQTTGLTFVQGDGTDDKLMFFTGTLANINAALSTVVYQSEPGFLGTDTIKITVDDQGATGNDGNKIANNNVIIKVAYTKPTDTGLPAEIKAVEGVSFTYNLANHFTDPNGNALEYIDLFVGAIGLDTSWITLDSNGIIHGIPQSGHIGSYHVEFDVKDKIDGEFITASFTLIVESQNDPPIVIAPANLKIEPEKPLLIENIAITDPDAGENPVKVLLVAESEKATIDLKQTAGLTFIMGDGTDDKMMFFIGTIANINAALAMITYQGDAGFSGTDKLTITADDQGYTGGGGNKITTKEIIISVIYTKPVNINLPAEIRAIESLTFSYNLSAHFNDPDGNALKYENLYIDSTEPLDTSWLILDPTGTLHGLPQNNHIGSYYVEFDVKDAVDGEFITASFTLIVEKLNNPPVVTVPVEQYVSIETPLQITGISIADPDAWNNPVKVLLVVESEKAVINLSQTTGLTFVMGDGINDKLIYFIGSLANINAALSTITYIGEAGYRGIDTVTITADDQGYTGAGGSKTHTAELTINVGVSEKGDVWMDGIVDLKDAITALQISIGIIPNAPIGGDVDGNIRINIVEAIYILMKTGGVIP